MEIVGFRLTDDASLQNDKAFAELEILTLDDKAGRKLVESLAPSHH